MKGKRRVFLSARKREDFTVFKCALSVRANNNLTLFLCGGFERVLSLLLNEYQSTPIAASFAVL